MSRLDPVLVVAAALAGAVLALLASLVAAEYRLPERCPPRERLAAPAAIHLVPGVVPHQSWVEFPVPEDTARSFVLCLDGHVHATAAHSWQAGILRFDLSTTWVNLQWLRGGLDALRQADRWYVAYNASRRPGSGRALP